MKILLAQTAGGFNLNIPQQIQGIYSKSSGFGGSLIGGIIYFLFVVAIIMALFFIVFGGFKWITSQGDPKEIGSARNTIIYAAIGLGIVLLSFFFVNIASCFVGIKLLGTQCH